MSLSLKTTTDTHPDSEKLVAAAKSDLKSTEKSPKAHRYNFLKVNEVSIVTEPAILSQEEADKGVGFPIVKFVDSVVLDTPVAITEKITLEAGEDIVGWMGRLVSESKLNLSVALQDGDAYHLTPVKVFKDTIIMTDPYKNPLANDTIFYKMTYAQDETGGFTFSRPVKLKLMFNEEGITSEKIHEIVKELPMSQITGIEVGGSILKITPMPGLEFAAEDGEIIFRCDENGVLHTGDNYVVDEDGVVRMSAPTEGDLTEEAKTGHYGKDDKKKPMKDGHEDDEDDKKKKPMKAGHKEDEDEDEKKPKKLDSEADATKFYLTADQLQSLMSGSGKSFAFKLAPDGTVALEGEVTIDPAAMVPTPPAPVAEKVESASTDNDDELTLRVKRLEEELAKAKQKIVGSSTTDPEVAENAVKVMGIAGYPVEQPLVPVDGNFQKGIFTRHIDKRLLDRGSRLQADLISG